MTSSAERGISSDHILGFARSLLSHRVGGRHEPHEVFQTSTIASLVEGLYDGNVAYRDVMRHGDFGVGTFNALDGEMVALDGRFFHLRSDGSASRVSGDELTPFAAVTWFRPNIDHTEDGPRTRKQCEQVIHRLAPSDNLFYALRIDGRFPTISTRTVSKQSKHSSYSCGLTGSVSARRRTNFLCQRATSGAPSAMRSAVARASAAT